MYIPFACLGTLLLQLKSLALELLLHHTDPIVLVKAKHTAEKVKGREIDSTPQ